MKRLLFVLATVALAACTLDTAPPEAPDIPSDPATQTFDSTLKIDLTKFTKTTNGVYYLDLKQGTGTSVSGDPLLTFRYAGFLSDAELFANNNVGTTIPLDQLILGLQEGLQGMKVGGERVLVIPSELGYGNQNRPGIPPNSTLVFDILLDGTS